MKQIIVSNIGATAKNGAGAPQVQVLGADGAWDLWAAASTDVNAKFRIFKAADGDLPSVASPAFTKADLKSCIVKVHAPSSAQVNTVTFTEASGAGVADGLDLTFRIIETSDGYEPFPRVHSTVKCGADASATAALIRADLVAKIAKSGSVASKIFAVSGSGAEVILTGIDVNKRFEVALESPEASGVTCYTAANVKTAAAAGVGVGAELREEEILQQGREYSGYDRLVVFDSFPNQIAAVSGQTYNLVSFVIQNSALNQIRGVDNMREIMVYLEEDATGDVYDLKSATGSTGFGRAIFGEGFVGAAINIDA